MSATSGEQTRSISIHALREEGDLSNRLWLGRLFISIHALREEGDALAAHAVAVRPIFLSTPSARRATCGRCCAGCRPVNFYPRPPRGGRLSSSMMKTTVTRFLSTPSARRATRVRVAGEFPRQEFLSTPSARRATAKTETKSLFSNKLYNILHEFRRALIYNGSKSYPNHAK